MTFKPVVILCGSSSDLPVVALAEEVLHSLKIDFTTRVLSAHRTPDETRSFVESSEKSGTKVFIAAAGLAAHLAGAVAAATVKPVIGIPLDAGSLGGLDALLSTVQMPAGVPVATVAIGKAGARNAAYLAAQILALSDAELAKRLLTDRAEKKQKILGSL